MSNLDIGRNISNINRQASISQQSIQRSQVVQNIKQGQNVDFKSLLEKSLKAKDDVTFSKHAQQRVHERQIDVSTMAMTNLNNAVSQAREKGVKDALILNGDTMFIVNTTNNIVVTALKGSEMKDNVFTNIDGTVII